VGEWLGASGHATFNFAPGVRPVPLEIHMHGLDIHNFEARMQVCSLCCMMWLLDAAAVLSPLSAFRIVWLWRLAWVLFGLSASCVLACIRRMSANSVV
jgi:hypothetical protein